MAAIFGHVVVGLLTLVNLMGGSAGMVGGLRLRSGDAGAPGWGRLTLVDLVALEDTVKVNMVAAVAFDQSGFYFL